MRMMFSSEDEADASDADDVQMKNPKKVRSADLFQGKKVILL
jgi:hypothetical protein